LTVVIDIITFCTTLKSYFLRQESCAIAKMTVRYISGSYEPLRKYGHLGWRSSNVYTLQFSVNSRAYTPRLYRLRYHSPEFLYSFSRSLP